MTSSSAPRRGLRTERVRHVRDRLPAQAHSRRQARHRGGQRRRGRGRPRAARPATCPSPPTRPASARPVPASAPSTPASAYLAASSARRRHARSGLVPAVLADEALAMGLVNKVVPRAPTTERQGVGVRDQREEPDRDQVPQAVVQRRHGPPGRLLQHGDDGARPLRGLDEGMEGAKAFARSASPTSTAELHH